jgi:hypothetical protein
MTKDTALRVHELVLSSVRAINEAVAIAQTDSSVVELEEFRLGAGTTMNAIFEELLKPIYRAHPELIPKELDRRYLKL